MSFKKIFSLLLISAMALSLCACSSQDKDPQPKATEAEQTGAEYGMYDEYEMVENLGEVDVDPAFDADAKAVKYNSLRSFGFYDGLDYLELFSNSSLDESEQSEGGEASEKAASGKVTYGYLSIDPKYVYKDSDAGLMLNFESIAEDYIKSYNKAIRKVGDFMITDYMDGVCINEYVYDKKKVKNDKLTVDIPEKLDGKKVIKLSGCAMSILEDEESEEKTYVETGFLSKVPDDVDVTLKLPSTVRDISNAAFKSVEYWDKDKNDDFESAKIAHLEVSDKNPWYSSESDALYNKNKSWLLYIFNEDREKFDCSESAKYVAAQALDDVSYEDDISVYFGKNIGRMYLDGVYAEEDDLLTFRVYKDSYADKFLRGKYNDKLSLVIDVDSNHIEYVK